MDLSKRDFSNPYICKVLFDTTGKSFPVAGSSVFQNFFDTDFLDDENFSPIYHSKGKISFSEKAEKTRAGMLYSQSLEMGFPSGDDQRSQRIFELLKTKHIGLILTNRTFIVLGRNDVFQNTPPKINVKTDQKSAVVGFETKTMFPSGYSTLQSFAGFPYLIPNL